MTKEDKATKKTSSLSISSDAIIVRGPLKFLNDDLVQDRLLEGVIVSGMFFERYGVEMLKKYFGSKGIDVKPLKIDEMKVSQIMSILQGFGLITNGTHSKICEVLKERNRIIHKVMFPDTINEVKARATIQKAIECLKDLNVIR
jgi:hypothetical protein